tara:strand:- start:114 stop:467 length:354 start_codon:yes stop_codon:yes gene_type:complete
MGKKRRLLAAKNKFGKKFSSHPRYKALKPVSTPEVNDDLNVIAKKIKTIETEVLETQEEINKVVIDASVPPEPVVVEAPTPVVAETVATTIPTPVVKTPKTRTRTTKTKRTRKTTKK